MAGLAEVGDVTALPPASVTADQTAFKARQRRATSRGPPNKMRKMNTLTLKVDRLSSVLAQIKELLLNHQPDNMGPTPCGDSAAGDLPCPEDNVLSTAATCRLFMDEGDEGIDIDKDTASQASVAFSEQWVSTGIGGWPFHIKASNSDGFGLLGAG